MGGIRRGCPPVKRQSRQGFQRLVTPGLPQPVVLLRWADVTDATDSYHLQYESWTLERRPVGPPVGGDTAPVLRGHRVGGVRTRARFGRRRTRGRPLCHRRQHGARSDRLRVGHGAWDRGGHGVVELPHVMHGYEALAGCDVVHDHTLLGPAWALANGHDRVVTTCHGPFDGEMRAIYR